MEIELPDGTVLDAPDGANIKQVVSGYQTAKLKQSNPGEYDPESPEYQAKYGPGTGTHQEYDPSSGQMKDVQNQDAFLANMGGEMTRFGKGTVNLLTKALNKVLPGKNDLTSVMTNNHDLVPYLSGSSDADLRAQDQLDKPLKAMPGGTSGTVAGDIAAGLPLSLATGGASTAARAIPYAGRVLGSGLLRGGVEGAANAAATASPDDQGDAALVGALTGGALSQTGKVINGIVKKSDAAQDLQHLAGQQDKDLFIPLSQAADEKGPLTTRLAKALYQEGLPLIPGAAGQLKGQSQRAMETVRELALSEADPTGSVVSAGSGKEGLLTRRALSDALDQQEQNTVGSYSFNVPSDFKDQVADRIKAGMPEVDDTTLDKVSGDISDRLNRYASGQTDIDGSNLLLARNSANAIRYSEPAEKAALSHGTKAFDDLISDQLSQGGKSQNLQDLADFQGLAGPRSALPQVGAAVEAAKANNGNFNPAQLARSSTDPGTLLHLGTTANEVLGKPVVAPSTAGKIAAYSLGGYSGLTHPAAAAGTIALGNAAATETVQKALMGDLGAQQYIKDYISKNPGRAKDIADLVRTVAETQSGKVNAPSQ